MATLRDLMSNLTPEQIAVLQGYEGPMNDLNTPDFSADPYANESRRLSNYRDPLAYSPEDIAAMDAQYEFARRPTTASVPIDVPQNFRYANDNEARRLSKYGPSAAPQEYIPAMRSPAVLDGTLGDILRQSMPQPKQPQRITQDTQQVPGQYASGQGAFRSRTGEIVPLGNWTEYPVQKAVSGSVTGNSSSPTYEPDMSQAAVDTPEGRGYRVKGYPDKIIIGNRIMTITTNGPEQRALEKEMLGLQKTRSEIANLNKPAASEFDKELAKLTANRAITGMMTPEERQKNAAKQAGVTLKPGERYNETTGQVEVVPGSTLGQKMSEEGIQTSKGLDAVQKQIERVGLAAKDILNNPNMNAAVGWWDALTPNWLSLTPQNKTDVASSIKNLQELLQTKGLQELRASGVAPGSITEREWSKFSAMIANIDPSISEDQFKQELKRVIQNTEFGTGSVAETRKQEQQRLGAFWPKSSDVPPPTGGGDMVSQIPTGAAPKVMTMQDVMDTAKKAGRTVDEVISAARAKGFTVR